MILEICDNPSILEIMRIIKILITIIKIIVPLILIISGMLTFIKAIQDSETSKALGVFAKKCIAAILIFLIPTFVNIIANTVNENNYISCFKLATTEGIQNAYKQVANNYVNNVKTSLSSADYSKAVSYINKNIKNESDKNTLLNTLKEYKNYIDIKEEIEKLKTNYNETSYNNIQNKLKTISDSSVKEKLETEFKKIQKPYKPGNPSGERRQSTSLSYSVHTPSQVLPNMPLILYLHGDGGGSSSGSSPFLTAAKKHFGSEIPFILVTPSGGMWAETNGRLAELKNIIDTECNKYECNKNRIVVTGHSRGSIGTWHMVNNYPNFFYSAVPVSCGSYRITPSNFKNTKIWAFGGNVGQNENRYSNEMSSNVNEINKAGGNAKFTLLKGAGHGDTTGLAYTKETILWMIN